MSLNTHGPAGQRNRTGARRRTAQLAVAVLVAGGIGVGGGVAYASFNASPHTAVARTASTHHRPAARPAATQPAAAVAPANSTGIAGTTGSHEPSDISTAAARSATGSTPEQSPAVEQDDSAPDTSSDSQNPAAATDSAATDLTATQPEADPGVAALPAPAEAPGALTQTTPATDAPAAQPYDVPQPAPNPDYPTSVTVGGQSIVPAPASASPAVPAGVPAPAAGQPTPAGGYQATQIDPTHVKVNYVPQPAQNPDHPASVDVGGGPVVYGTPIQLTPQQAATKNGQEITNGNVDRNTITLNNGATTNRDSSDDVTSYNGANGKRYDNPSTAGDSLASN